MFDQCQHLVNKNWRARWFFNNYKVANYQVEVLIKVEMEFGLRPKDRPGVAKAAFGLGAGSLSAREHRKIGKSTAWISDFGSLTYVELEEKYPSGLFALGLIQYSYFRLTSFLY